MRADADLSRRGFLTSLGLGAAAIGLAPEAFAEPASSARLPTTVAAAKSAFALPPDLTYLNNGSLGPCPTQVIDASIAAWRQLETDPVGQNWGDLGKAAEAVREQAAAFIGCNTDELAVTRNTSEAMGLIAQGITWQAGDHVLTTNHEHGGGLHGWRYVARRLGVIIDTAELPLNVDDPRQIVDCLAEKITDQTKVISVSHVTYTTGLRLPIARIAELARAHGALLIVDGAQAPGAIDVDVAALNCDAYATSAHKWILAPKGTGLLFIRKEAAEKIQPMMLQDGMRLYTAAAGTRDLPSVVGLGAAMTFLSSIGKTAVESHAMQLRAQLVEQAAAINGVTICGGRHPDLQSAIATLALPEGVNSGALAGKLREKHNVVVRAVSGKLVNGLRVSMHVYNSGEDVTRLIDALKSELT